jgi:eukaryotic-like serine/threonine-protein kinase
MMLPLEEGSVLARKYELLRAAGFGGMAQLWVAKNRATGAEVCIKVLVPEKTDDEIVERFRREAYAAARLSHRAIIRIFDLVELGASYELTTDRPAALAIVMELLRGETLGDFLMKRGALPVEEAIDLALPVVSGLAHAHRAGVVHRDLKPDNIFLAAEPDGHIIPKILDFGVSKLESSSGPVLTVDGAVLGTPTFMSPEQARGARNVDARSDVFSAGILLYVMLAGSNPFERDSFHGVVSAILSDDPPRLASVPDALWAVLAKALAKDASERFADATELGVALRRASGRTSITESGPQSLGDVPIGVRKIVTPLGGDSHVSVPPVSGGGLEPQDPHDDALPPATNPAVRRRALRIVLAVVGASLALTMAALLRPPSGSSASQAPSATTSREAASAAPASANASAKAAAAAPTTTASAAAVSTAAPAVSPIEAEAGAAKPPPTSERVPAPKPTAAPSHAATPPRKAAPGAVTQPPREPSIVRDPGF